VNYRQKWKELTEKHQLTLRELHKQLEVSGDNLLVSYNAESSRISGESASKDEVYVIFATYHVVCQGRPLSRQIGVGMPKRETV